MDMQRLRLFSGLCMPELPEVEIVKNGLQEIVGLDVLDVKIFNKNSLSNILEENFQKKIKNKKILEIFRRGKNLVFKFSNFFLIIHLKMTGKLILKCYLQKVSKHERIRFYLSNNKVLSFDDVRKFGNVCFAENLDDKLSKLGPEPLSKEFSVRHFKERLYLSKVKIKTFLLDQSKIAGIGNIYADESLFLAKIHPLKFSNQLSNIEIENLFTSIRSVLEKGIENRGTSLGHGEGNFMDINANRGNNKNFLRVYSREGQKCFTCSNKIQKIKICQRSSFFCLKCQKK